MTPATVDAVLDEVRPYLIADGGNVEVVAVDNGVVMLRLQVHTAPLLPLLAVFYLQFLCPRAPSCMPSDGCFLEGGWEMDIERARARVKGGERETERERKTDTPHT